MHLRTCGSFKSANHKKNGFTNSISAKCHICGRSPNIINYLFPQKNGGFFNLKLSRQPSEEQKGISFYFRCLQHKNKGTEILTPESEFQCHRTKM
jgi:hypothetical protein